MIKTFLDDFGKKADIKGFDPDTVLYIPSGFEEFVTELIGKVSKKAVYLLPYDSNTQLSCSVVKVGDRLDSSLLLNLGYEKVERVWSTGEFSVLGDTYIVWPFSSKYVLRLTLFGEEIEEIAIVEPDSRKKVEDVDSVRIFRKNEGSFVSNENGVDILQIRFVNDPFLLKESIDFGISRLVNMPSVGYRERAFSEFLSIYKKRGYEIWYISKDILKVNILDSDRKLFDRVYEVSDVTESSLKKGFVYEKAKLLVLTDREVLGELELSSSKMSKDIDQSSVEILKKIVPGDFVVHEDHGIGKFVGVSEREGGTYIEIAYAGNDRLFIPFSASSKIMKYIASGKYQPRLTGLSSGLWKRISTKAKEDVEDVAKELLQIYAMREISQGINILGDDISMDEYWKFSNEFKFTDTEDQYLATKKISEDLSSGRPMDRLLVGDVGFGKTEIGMRATFAVANHGMQVAVLAPTTVLANQHLRVFRKRFKKYPFRIEVLSRLQSNKERERVLEELKNGKVDILIGTHALIADTVKFKNLGLFVIDEEQKFGVKQKEKLKSRRVDTHVLSMTATPIPRTLNMSLLGVRDISVLAIPPSGRIEISNEFASFSYEKVKECILREIQRGGQVYYLHNSIESIYFVEEKIKEMIPDIKIQVAHGRLSGDRLINVMDSFLNGEIDVLLCTTIIENGLDISNANTLIVDDVNRLGLSQMYQIRGRVGRGQKRAYACFFYESLKGDSSLRLEAIKESQSLGSGFLLSSRDLEIRGAGDILGKKQSGTINSIGYGLYTQLLKEAVLAIKGS